MWIDDSASELPARLVRRVLLLRLCGALCQVTRLGALRLKLILSVWAVGTLLGSSSIASAEPGPDFEAWREACARLPKNLRGPRCRCLGLSRYRPLLMRIVRGLPMDR